MSATTTAPSSADHTAPAASPAAADGAPRAALARRAVLGAAALGIIADPLLRHEPWGLGLVVWMVLFALVVVTLVRAAGRPLRRDHLAWLTIGVSFAGGLAWRDADLLHVFDMLAMLSALVLLAMSLNGLPVPNLAMARLRDLFRAAVGTALAVAAGIVPLMFRVASSPTDGRPERHARVRGLVRGLIITVPLVMVFTALFSRADPVFGAFIAVPEWDFELLWSHVVIAGFFAWVVGGWLRRALFTVAPSAMVEFPLPFSLSATDVTIALGTLNVLFATFVVVQIGWLFGGQDLVLRTTGLGYAEYARRGFFELMAVAGLLLPVLLGAHALIPVSEARTLRSFRRLAFMLVVLLGAIMVSAAVRMQLYVHYYGISADRLYASVFMAWLAIVFTWLTMTVLRGHTRPFAIGVVSSALVVLGGLNVIDPIHLVARANLSRGEADAAAPGVAGPDRQYLATLGGGAIPLLVTHLVAAPAGVGASAADRCAAARMVLDRWTGERAEQRRQHWTQWNLARSRAARAVIEHEAALRQLACPLPPAPVVAPVTELPLATGGR